MTIKNATNHALDELAKLDKARGGTGSDYAVAKLMEVPTNIISNYRRGVSQMDDDRAIKAAELLGREPLRLIGEINAERARSERSKKFWRQVRDNTAGGIAVMMTAFALAATPFPSQASAPVDDLYNARNPRRRRAKKPWLRWLFSNPIPDVVRGGAPAPA